MFHALWQPLRALILSLKKLAAYEEVQWKITNHEKFQTYRAFILGSRIELHEHSIGITGTVAQEKFLPGFVSVNISKYLLTEQSVNAWIWKTQKSWRRRERNMMTSPQFCPHWDKSSARRRYCCIIFLNFSCIDIKLNIVYYLFVPEGNNLISIMKKYRLAFCNMNFHWRTRKNARVSFVKLLFI